MSTTTDASSGLMHNAKAILVVEDDRRVGTMLVDAFQMEPSWYVFLAANATEALRAVETLIPNLVVLDYQLPDTNGLELADHLHSLDKLKHIPLLFVSANPPKQALKERHIACLQKPFGVHTLLSVARNLLTP